jgi:hypothetical protein
VTANAVGCTVLIGGAPISDGCTSLDPDAPAVLSGLRIIWGRSSTVDQPVASSCVFTVLDPISGDQRLVPSLAIGRRVDVRADTVVYPDPTVSTIPVLIPSDLQHTTRATVAPPGTVTAVADGTGLQLAMTFPPLAYTSDPLGWDTVPRSLPGQQWRYRATVTAPAPFAGFTGWAAQLRPVTFTDPDGSDARLIGPVTPAAPSVDVTFTPPPGVWLGLQVAAYPTSPAWLDLDGTTWQQLGAAPTWEQLGTFTVTAVQLLAPAAGAADSAMVFSGRITDITASWDGGADSALQVIAQDWLAELANRFVGDSPWAAESLTTRAQRIVALSGQPVTLTVDPAPGALQVTYRDVDRQAAAGLLQQLATTGGSVLWTATHLVTGQVMRIEDVAARPAALTLSTAGTGLVHVIPSPAAKANALPITACDIDADPVRFILDTTATVSMVALTWLEQVPDPGPPATIRPTQRTVELTAPQTYDAIGARRMSVSTQLTTQADGTAQATQWLARTSVLAWRIEGLTWDTAGDLTPAQVKAVMRLIDGTRRNGLPITLTDLPPWVSPMTADQGAVALYVEGGSYEYHAGAWTLAVNTSSANASAIGTLPWQNLDAGWRWLDFDPGVRWLDLYGVTYPPS